VRRLAQPEGQWKPFERSGLRSLVYPDPRRTAHPHQGQPGDTEWNT
jgi:hypothetical protein